jgi:hypothetical protein
VLAGAGVHRPLRARGSVELAPPRCARGRGSALRCSTAAAGCRPPGRGGGGPSSAISPVREPKQGRPAAERAPSWASPPARSPGTWPRRPRSAQLQVLLQLVLLALFPAPPLPRLVPPMTRSSLLGFPGAQGLGSWRHWIEFAHEHASPFNFSLFSVYTRCKYSVTVYAVEDLPMSVHTIFASSYF